MSESSGVMVATCACGFKVRYGRQHVGRTVKCKHCESPLTLPPPIELEDEYELMEPEIKLPDARPLEERTTRTTEIKATEAAKTNPILLDREARLAQRRENGFWKDAFGAFAFAMNAESLLKAVFLVIAFVITDFIPSIVGLVLSLAVIGLSWGFYFNIVQYSAGGDNDLPDPFELDSTFDSIVVPFFSMVLISVGLAIIPLLVAIVMPDNTNAVAVATGVSVFLWPAVILLVALGGISLALRVDLALRTIFSAFIPYLFIWLMLGIALLTQTMALGGGASWIPDFVLETNIFVLSILTNLFTVFLMIISMKIIGLYYRHYSDRFPWSAG